MKRVFSMILALLMVVGTMVVMPLTATAADTGAWDGKATKPAGTGRETDPYIIDSAGDLLWFSNQSSPRVLNTIGYDHKVYVAQYQSYYEGQDSINGLEDLGDGDIVGFENDVAKKYVDFTKPMVRLTKYDKNIITADMADTWNYGDKIYLKQVCDIDMGGQMSTPVAKYWSYGNGTRYAKGTYFNGTYDGQGYTIKNGNFNQATNGNTAWACGMFGTLWGATIKNIVFEGVTAFTNKPENSLDKDNKVVYSQMPGIGLIATQTLDTASMGSLSAEQAAKIGETNIMNIKADENCQVISTDNAAYGVGGILGKANANTNVTSCVYLGKVNAALDDTRVGGIVGVLVPKNTEVTGNYFGGEIVMLPKVNNTAVATDAVKWQLESHLGGIVGNWAGTFTGTNKLSHNVNYGKFTGTATIDETVYLVNSHDDKQICVGGILGAASMLVQGSGATIEFKGNINLSPSTRWLNGAGKAPVAGTGSDPVVGKTTDADRVSSMMGCYYRNADTQYKLTMEDCHTVEAWGFVYTYKNAQGKDTVDYPPTSIMKSGVRKSGWLLESNCSVIGDDKMFTNKTAAEAMYLVNNGYFQGEGTEENPWKIGSIADWDFFDLQMSGSLEFVRNDAFEGKYLVQTADLDFAGATRLPLSHYQPTDWHYTATASSGKYEGYVCENTINEKGNAFRGTYDGQGYAIKNLKLRHSSTSTSNDYWAGSSIFGHIYGATLKNIVLDNVSADNAKGYSGLLVSTSKACFYDFDMSAYKQYEVTRTTTVEVTAGSAEGKFNRTTTVVDTWMEGGEQKTNEVSTNTETDVEGLTVGTKTTTQMRLVGNASDVKTAANVPADFNVIENVTVKDNCSLTITETAANRNGFGGIIGCAEAVTIRNCYSGATLKNTSALTKWLSGIGGIAGNAGVAHNIIDCIGNADITWVKTATCAYNSEMHFCGGIVGNYKPSKTTATTAQNLIKGCVNTGSFTFHNQKEDAMQTTSYGGIVGMAGTYGTNFVADTIGGHKIENCYNLSTDIKAIGKSGNKLTPKGNNWRIGGIIGGAWITDPTSTNSKADVRDQIQIVNCSTVDLSGINTSGYAESTYLGVIGGHTNRNCKDDGKVVPNMKITNNDGSTIQVKTDAQTTILQTLVKSKVANVIKTKEALHFYGHQIKSANGSRDVRFLYDFANLTLNGVKTKEVRFNITVVGEGVSATKTVVQNTVYTSFLNHDDGGATKLTPSAGMNYMAGLTIKDIPSTGTYTIYIDAMLVGQSEDTRVETCVRRDFGVTMTLTNGAIDVK